MQFFHSVYSDTITATSLFDAFDLVGFDDGKVTIDDAPVMRDNARQFADLMEEEQRRRNRRNV